MKIDINKIVPNPFRDFELDPIDPVQVARLAHSINDLGFFSGVTARKRADGLYELACGHHRWKAAVDAKMDYVEAVVDTYTDNEMRRIMAIENLTQRGANTGAVQDAVAAYAFQVAYEALTDRTGIARNSASSQQLAQHRGMILKDGPGERSIYQAINGFSRDEAVDRKAEDPKAEMISMTSVKNAVAALKESGYMAKIVAKAYAVVEAERREDEAKAAEEKRKAELKRWEEENRQRKLEEERAAKAERDAKAAKEALERAEKEKAEQAERQRLAEQKRKADEEAARQRRAAEDAERQRQREANIRRAEAAREEALKEKERRMKEEYERHKVQEQLEQKRFYDIRCDQLFPHPEYAGAFRKAVIDKREFISRDEQYDLAKAIVASADKWKQQFDHTVGTDHIRGFILNLANERMAEEKQAEADRQAQWAKVDASMRVTALWGKVKAGMVLLDQSMRELGKEHEKWNTETHGAFPPPVDLIDTYGTLERIQRLMRSMYGDIYGGNVVDAEIKQIV